MVEFKTREEFVAGVMQLLHLRPNSNVMVIVESPSGLETMQTSNSFVWCFGLLAAAEKMFDERYRQAMETAEAKRSEIEADQQMSTVMSVPDGKAN